MRGNPHEVENFLRWMESLPHKHKIFVPGNHDFLFDTHRSDYGSLYTQYLNEFSPSVTYLRDKGCTVEGLHIYGTPWAKGLEAWAFGWKSDSGREAEFAAIPPNTDILITHGPSKGVLDTYSGFSIGDEQLRDRVQVLPNLKLHVHGHIHESHGSIGVEGVLVINAAICDESYTPSNKPFITYLT